MALSHLLIIAIFLLALLLNSAFGSGGLGYIFLTSAFLLPQIILLQLIPGGNVGINSGGSPLYNLALLGLQCGLVLLFLTNRQIAHKSSIKSFPNDLKSSSLFTDISFFLMIFLNLLESFLSTTKIIPVSQALLYLFVALLIKKKIINFDTFLRSILNSSFVLIGIIFLSIVFRYNWNQSSADFDLLQSDIYFSPIGSMLGLSVHNGGPFGAPNDLGIFCAFICCLAMSTRILSRNIQIPLAILSALTGSMSGSRTFYLLFACSCMLAILSHVLPADIGILMKTLSVSFLVLFIYFMGNLFVSKITSNARNVSTLSGRSTLWRLILENWQEKGFFGHGPNTLRPYMITHTWEIAFGHAHNSFLQYLWDWGVLGALCYLSFFLNAYIVTATKVAAGRSLFYFLCLVLCLQTELNVSFDMTYKGVFALLIYASLTSDHDKAKE